MDVCLSLVDVRAMVYENYQGCVSVSTNATIVYEHNRDIARL